MNKFKKLYEDATIPKRQTAKSAGYDAYSYENTIVPSMGRALIKIGVTAYMNDNEALLVCSRSGLAIKQGIQVLNAPGIVDADYTPNEIGVILYNTTQKDFMVNKGDRIAQLMFINYYTTDDDNTVGKRIGGFGSSGTK